MYIMYTCVSVKRQELTVGEKGVLYKSTYYYYYYYYYYYHYINYNAISQSLFGEVWEKRSRMNREDRHQQVKSEARAVFLLQAWK